ncbi:MAG: cytochrome P450 [Tumebacillaceae bacterium]
MTASKTFQDLPVFGSFEVYAQDPLGFYLSIRDQGDIVQMFGQSGQFVVNNPELIREVLVIKHEHFIKGREVQVLKTVIGEGVLTSEKAENRRQRQMVHPHFSLKQVTSYAEMMTSLTEEQIAQWRDGEVRNMTDEMMLATLEIITHTMFGTSVRGYTGGIARAMETAQTHLAAIMDSDGQETPEALEQRDRELSESVELLDQVLYGIIEERRQNPERSERRDLLSVFLRSGMSDKELRDQMMTIFTGGHETTANTLAWTWFLLAQHPEVERKFHQELEEVLGGRTPTAADYDKLKYTLQIVQESLRVYPAGWVITREVDSDVEIGGYQFLKGQMIQMCQFATQRDPKWFENPDAFIPERFAGDMLKQIPEFAYFPFGGGPRLCTGYNFALLEAVLVLATIGQKYKLSLVEGTEVVPLPLVTLRAHNLQMKIEAR